MKFCWKINHGKLLCNQNFGFKNFSLWRKFSFIKLHLPSALDSQSDESYFINSFKENKNLKNKQIMKFAKLDWFGFFRFCDRIWLFEQNSYDWSLLRKWPIEVEESFFKLLLNIWENFWRDSWIAFKASKKTFQTPPEFFQCRLYLILPLNLWNISFGPFDLKEQEKSMTSQSNFNLRKSRQVMACMKLQRFVFIFIFISNSS